MYSGKCAAAGREIIKAQLGNTEGLDRYFHTYEERVVNSGTTEA